MVSFLPSKIFLAVYVVYIEGTAALESKVNSF
jgi:hypothetical protein